MNEQPWFTADGLNRGERPEMVHIDEAAFIAQPDDDSVKADFGEDDTQDCQQPEGDYYGGDDEPKRFGNNRKHVKKAHAKARRKIAKKSKQRNRK